MIDSRAEQSFANGRRALESERYREAVAFFKGAADLTAGSAGNTGHPRYVSYYGLALCLSRAGGREALRCCRQAAALQPDRAELWWNLGRVAYSLGRRGEAYRAWTRGLTLDEGNRPIRNRLQRMGVRRAPVLSFLPRNHPVNVTLGRLRSRCTRGPTASAPLRAQPAVPAGSEGQFLDESGNGIVGVRVIG